MPTLLLIIRVSIFFEVDVHRSLQLQQLAIDAGILKNTVFSTI
uniref:Uncharacterized protein n=1 Tax=Klebsiella pneumoniae subsp. pneumoniae TaxID=72407 RepID=A0A6G8F5N7_KLEPN|nr:hypothetical protein [Klebsiella pneumoniae subsp. pneumoniae]QIM11385.1 hypothetical protein [Klebsiella pneumoniae subsp. pneumoniae]